MHKWNYSRVSGNYCELHSDQLLHFNAAYTLCISSNYCSNETCSNKFTFTFRGHFSVHYFYFWYLKYTLWMIFKYIYLNILDATLLFVRSIFTLLYHYFCLSKWAVYVHCPLMTLKCEVCEAPLREMHKNIACSVCNLTCIVIHSRRSVLQFTDSNAQWQRKHIVTSMTGG